MVRGHLWLVQKHRWTGGPSLSAWRKDVETTEVRFTPHVHGFPWIPLRLCRNCGWILQDEASWRILTYGYGSIPINNTIFSGMNIHLPAILMFTRGTRFWHTAILVEILHPKDEKHGDMATPRWGWARGCQHHHGWLGSLGRTAEQDLPVGGLTLDQGPTAETYTASISSISTWIIIKDRLSDLRPSGQDYIYILYR